jgi:hypothetical protein
MLLTISSETLESAKDDNEEVEAEVSILLIQFGSAIGAVAVVVAKSRTVEAVTDYKGVSIPFEFPVAVGRIESEGPAGAAACCFFASFKTL